jgi:MFS family permease
MAKPFETRIQNLVYNVDVGVGLRLTKAGLYFLFVFITMLLYTATQFHGLKDADAMETAQLGRNLLLKKAYVTQCIRPSTVWGLTNKSPKHSPMVNAHPEILHPPLWPALLAAGFKVTRTPFTSEKPGTFPPEQWAVIPMCHLFTLLTGLMVYLLGRRLFDPRVALLAATVYFLSDTVWADSISGTALPLTSFLAVSSFYFALGAVLREQEEDQPARRWAIPLALSALFCILAFHARYAAAVLAPALAVFIGASFRKKGWIWALVFLAVFLLGIAPWLVRNKLVSGGILGMAPYAALNHTASFEGNTFERMLKPAVTLGKAIGDLQGKFVTNLLQFYNVGFRTIGDGLFICLFLTAFFYRFVRDPAHRLRWSLALALVLLLLVAAVFGEETARLLHIFWPFIIVYGLAFFFILLDRLQLSLRIFSLGTTTAFVGLAALPLVLTMMPPRVGVPYPPYYPPFPIHVCKMLGADEMICTDMPWATAWYGNRTSMLVPLTIEEFYEVNDYVKRVSGLYFTTITRNRPYVSGLLTGPDKTWMPILEGRMPPDFPLNQGFPINNMDQLFLTDRVRWEK